VIDGETVLIEIEMPLSASPADLHVAVPWLSHLVTSPARDFAPCGAAACDEASGPANGAAAARIVFTEAGDTFACNGMLLADRDAATVIPFFLTARHCIATQSVASSAQPFWPDQRVACGAAASVLAPGAQGATLLHADADTDLTLLRLQKAPPAGAVYAGWVVGSPIAEPESVKIALSDATREGTAEAASALAPQLGECVAGGSASARFQSAYNAGLYQWLGGTPQDAAEASEIPVAGGS
jgi:hypothetical protein